MKHLNIKIFGRVQGINFRWNTRHKAWQLGISGYVRNLPDGSVFIEAEGEEQALDKLVAWCRKGPWFAKVTDIQVEAGAIMDYDEFVIRH